MPSFDIIKQSNPNTSFRVQSVIGKFDLQSSKVIERFKGDIELPKNWNVGLIFGKSGTGKTTISKQLFENFYITSFDYKEDCILNDMPQDCSIEEITKSFNSVGFSSPPSWLKSYSSLSNGEKMRVDLARAILEKKDMFVFDEFTSVVDRQVAKIGSFAIQKTIRKLNKKFIAVTCHYDVLDWLLPDWVFNTDSMTFQNFEGQKKNRPKIKIEIYQTGDKKTWEIFRKYHYLSHTHNNSANVFLAFIDDELAGFLSVLHFPHPKVKNLKKVHRLVILPDYQGAGFGIIFLNKIAEIYANQKFRFNIVTSAPSLIYSLKKSKNWIATRFGRVSNSKGILKNNTSSNRITVSFEYKNKTK